MSKRLFLLPLLFISSAVIGLSAFNKANADGKDVNIALVNIQKIEEDSSASKDMRKKMANKENELRQELLKRKNKLESDFKSLESKRSMLSTEELQKHAQKLEGDYQKLQIDEQKYGQIFEATKMIVFGEFQEYIKKATNKVANSKYDMVIPFGLALYVNDEYGRYGADSQHHGSDGPARLVIAEAFILRALSGFVFRVRWKK